MRNEAPDDPPGRPGSGKSSRVKEHGLERYTLSADNLRLLFGAPVLDKAGQWGIDQKLSKRTWLLLFELLEARTARDRPRRFEMGTLTLAASGARVPITPENTIVVGRNDILVIRAPKEAAAHARELAKCLKMSPLASRAMLVFGDDLEFAKIQVDTTLTDRIAALERRLEAMQSLEDPIL